VSDWKKCAIYLKQNAEPFHKKKKYIMNVKQALFRGGYQWWGKRRR
jgi:hypothetical protein